MPLDDSCGCWLDGQRGHYIGRDTIMLAKEFGMRINGITQYLCDTYEDNYFKDSFPHEYFDDEVYDAMNWLNDNIAPEGTCFVFDDGFYLLSTDDNC